MSDAQRLRGLLHQIQAKLSQLGNSNKTKWNIFSTDTEISIQEFIENLGNLGIRIKPQDAATLWSATGITNNRMRFNEFVRFLQAENIQMNKIATPPSKPSNLLNILQQNRRSLLLKLTEADPSTTGYISHRLFSEICSWFTDSNDITPVINKYDPSHSGSFNYFFLLADLCDDEQAQHQDNPQVSPSSPRSTYDQSFSRNLSPRSSPPYGNFNQADDSYQSPTKENSKFSSKQSPRNGNYSPFSNQSPRSGNYSPFSNQSNFTNYDNNIPSPSSNYSNNFNYNSSNYNSSNYNSNNYNPNNYNTNNYNSNNNHSNSYNPNNFNSNNYNTDNYNSYKEPNVPPAIDISFSRDSNLNLEQYQTSPIRNPPMPRNPGQTSGNSGGRSRLDPAIFGQMSPKSPSGSSQPSGGRRNLDPSIFGQKPLVSYVPEQPVAHADDFVNADHISGLSSEQLKSLIEKHVSQCSKSAKVCYNKWRGSHELMTANDLRDGLARDANIVVPYQDIEMILQQYGGPLSLSSFVRMISDGREIGEKVKSIQGAQEITADDAAIERIAQQIVGTAWETDLMKAVTVEEACRALQNHKIYVDPKILGPLQSKLGKMGLINSIKAHLYS